MKLVAIITFVFPNLVWCFNLAPEFAVIVTDPLKEDSYFGYAVQFLNRSGFYRIIIGAPKSRSNHHPYIQNPGAVYECYLADGTVNRCLQIQLERNGESTENLKEYSYKDKKKDAWIGGALAVNENTGLITVCGARWINQYHEGYYLMNGICYVLPNDDVHNVDEIHKLLPLLESGKQGYKIKRNDTDPQSFLKPTVEEVFFYSYGEAGFSVQSFDNEIIIGAPGVMHWKGTVIRHDTFLLNYSGKQFGTSFVPNTHFTEDIKFQSYLGYSVAHGKFFNDPKISYVAGAPRAGAYRGKVYIFKMPKGTEEPLIIEMELKGRQMGEYFGAALCVADLNNDGYDDILVGAPQHSENDRGDTPNDEGKVYVFLNDGKGNFKRSDLAGSKISGARFGSAISSVGDLDFDGYPEIAIGAPYEKESSSYGEGTGSVYIYKSGKNGVSRKYVQRIRSRDVGTGIKGFGISISKGADVDGNHYNDISVGAYESGHVILIKSKPVVSVFHSLTPSIDYIQQNTTGFGIEICFKYEGSFVPSQLDLNVEVTLDKILKRAYFAKGSTYMTHKSTLIREAENCEIIPVFLDRSNLKKYYSALPIALNYSIATKSPTEFCKTCPVIDPSQGSYEVVKIPVMSKCDKITMCIPDWKITAEFPGLNIPFVIGSADSIDLKIKISNRGDTSTLKHFTVVFPENVSLKTVPTACNKFTEDSWKCLNDVVIFSEQEEILDLVLDVTKLEIGSGMSRFEFLLSSLDDASEKVDKNFTLSLKLKEEHKIEVSAKANPTVYIETIEGKKTVALTHDYHIYNSGFTKIRNLIFRCEIPEMIFWKTSTLRIFKSHRLKATMNSENVQCELNVTSHLKMDESQNPTATNKISFMDCSRDEIRCLTYNCFAPKLHSRSDGIHIEIKIPVLAEALKSLFENSFHIYYNTSLKIFHKEEFEKSVATRFDGASIPEKVDPWLWLYIVSAIVFAIILLSVIILILHKKKFFERLQYKKQEDQGNLIANDLGKSEISIEDANASSDQD